ncbi:hypothetical protein SISNIDRAFT_413529, partial [Sistotremastrum niveocremeum HHB9708]
WAPFDSREDWELAKWLIGSGLTQKKRDEFLKLSKIRNCAAAPWPNNLNFLKKIDKLPKGPEWQCERIRVEDTVEVDAVTGETEKATEVLELWKRDPTKCIRDLMGNPLYRSSMRYRPERQYRDAEHTNRIYDEMWTSDWWWDIQKELPSGATVAPLILASDKTQLTNFSGNRAAWPVYLTLGNISKTVRRQTKKHATVLIGYLPIPKLAHITNPEQRSIEMWRIFHDSMAKLLEPLVEAGQHGMDVTCADREIRRVFPILASYVADFPEQCLIAGIKNTNCPICHVSPEDRGEGMTKETRQTRDAVYVLQQWWEKHESAAAEHLGYKKIWPFWATLPHQNIFECFTPDILHQLHKGNFKDHLVKWCLKLAPEKHIDQRFQAMTSFHGLRHFAAGISKVKQWSGTEYKNMEKTFLSVIDGIVPSKAVKATQALLDFMYLARFPIHTDESLRRMELALQDYHELKPIFMDLEACDSFEIPKLHAISHYIAMIRLKGTADGYNTESPERLHIDFAKLAYRASNKVQPIKQMTLWLQRQEAVNKQEAYLSWIEEVREQRKHQRRAAEMGLEVLHEEDNPLPHPSTAIISRPGNPRHALTTTPSSNLSISAAATTHKIPDLLPAIRQYIALIVSPRLPNLVAADHQISIWHRTRVTVSLPTTILYDDDNDKPDVIASHPALPKTKWKEGKKERYDTCLLYRFPDEEGLERYQVARVRLIFTLPRHLHCIYPPIPLAYVELYQPFRTQPHKDTGMWVIRPQIVQGKQVAEIVPLGSIHMACHLAPQFGSTTNSSWTTDNVFDRCSSFYFNTYSSLRMFSFVDHFSVTDPA